MISSKTPRLVSQDVSQKMREAFEKKANQCECGHGREDHENGTGKCRHTYERVLKFKFKGKGKKRKKVPAKTETMQCCGKFRPSIGIAGYVDDAMPAIFGAQPAQVELEKGAEAAKDVLMPVAKELYNKPPDGVAISGNPKDPKPKDLTTIEDNARDVIVRKGKKKKKIGHDIKTKKDIEIDADDNPFTDMEEIEDMTGRSLVSPKHQEELKKEAEAEKVTTAPHKLKTAFVSNSFPMGAYRQPLIGAGLVNWAKALGSEILPFQSLPSYYSKPDINGKKHLLLNQYGAKKIDEFDWVFVNLAGTDIGIPTAIRRSIGDSDTKVIGINDYAVETLQNIFQPFPDLSLMRYWTDILHCNLLMAQEPYELEVFQYLVHLQKDRAARTKQTGTYPKLTLISHPVNTIQLKEWSSKVTMDMRQPILSVMYHRADGQTWYPSLLSTDTDPSWFNGAPLKTALYGYVDRYNIFGSEDKLFDIAFEFMTFGEFMQFFVTSIVGFDYYTIHSHSRFASEAACLRVPIVSTTFSYNAMQLYPETTHHYWDWHKLHNSINDLATKEEFWNKTVDFAYEQVEQFGYEASVMKLKTVMDMVK